MAQALEVGQQEGGPKVNVSYLGEQKALCIAQPANTQPSAHLQQQALLRVHEVRLRPGNAEQGRIKAVHSAQESAVPHTQLRFAGLRQRRASGAELSMMLRWTCTATDCPASPSPNLDPWRLPAVLTRRASRSQRLYGTRPIASPLPRLPAGSRAVSLRLTSSRPAGCVSAPSGTAAGTSAAVPNPASAPSRPPLCCVGAMSE